MCLKYGVQRAFAWTLASISPFFLSYLGGYQVKCREFAIDIFSLITYSNHYNISNSMVVISLAT